MKKRRNASKTPDSRSALENKTRAPGRGRTLKSADSLSKFADSGTSPSVSTPGAELSSDGRIGAVLGGLLARTNERDQKGRYTRENTGHLATLEHSAQLWRGLEPLKQEIIGRVRSQLGADTDDAPETLLGVIDAYAEARLLRSSAFVRLSQLGGFLTNKGKSRALLSTWGAAFDREMRAAEKLGLVRRARRAQTTLEWLESLGDANDQQKEHDDERDETHDDTNGTDAGAIDSEPT